MTGRPPEQAQASAVRGELGRTPSGALGAFQAALEGLLARPVRDDDDPSLLHAELRAMQQAKRRLDTRVCRTIAALHRQEEGAAAADSPEDPDRAAARAARELGRELREDLGLTPSQVKAARAVGERLADTPALGAAMDAGTITQAHARILDRTLRGLGGRDRLRLEEELVALASTGINIDRFRDECTRALARADRQAAANAEARRHARRRASLVPTEDGMTALHAQFAGLQAEVAHTAINAFRRPDADGERRTAEQRTADALHDALAAALEGGKSSTQHGIRPHVVITVPLGTVVSGGDGLAEGMWTGPLIWDRVRRILDDSSVSFLAIGNDLPVAVTEEVRTVPAATWKGLAHRDGGCIEVRCDIPVPWTEVMHLGVPYAKGGRLTFATSGLGCAYHHEKFDNGQLELRWTDGRPTLHPPKRKSGRAPGLPPPAPEPG